MRTRELSLASEYRSLTLLRVLPFALVAVILPPPVAFAQAGKIDQAILKRLKTDGIPSWEKLDSVWKHDFGVVGESEKVVVFEGAQVLTRTEQFKVCFNDEFRLIERQWTFDKDGIQKRQLERRIANNRYSFLVRQVSGGPFTLAEAERSPSGAPPVHEQHLDYQWFVDVGSRIWFDVTIEVAISDPQFRVTQLQEETDEKGSWVRLVAVCDVPERTFGRFPGATYWAKIRPDNHWLVEESGVDLNVNSVKYNVTVDYQEAFRDIPFPKTIKVRRGSDPDTYDERSITFSIPTNSFCSKKEFYTPYYGISESALDVFAPVERSRISLVWAGVVGIGVAFLLLWVSRRFRARAK